MPRSCTVCRHPEREAIDASLLKNEALRAIGRRTGLTHRALARHKQGHLLAGGGHPEPTGRSGEDGRARRLESALQRARDILRRGELAPDWESAVNAIREARIAIEQETVQPENGVDQPKDESFAPDRAVPVAH